MDLPNYQRKEGGKFLTLKEAIPETGDSIRLKVLAGQVKDGDFGVKILELKVLTEQNEEKTFKCDAPDEANDHTGSQVYRGIKDNDINEDDVMVITNGGRMTNKYRTAIYNVAKDVTRPAPTEY